MYSARLLLLTMTLAAAPRIGGAQSSGCEPSLTSDEARTMLGFARFTVSGMDPGTIRVRTAIGLPVIDTTKVVLTTMAKTCTDAVAGINAKQGTPGRVRRIHLVKLNTSGYMAFEPVYAPGLTVRPVYVLSKTLAVTNLLLGL